MSPASRAQAGAQRLRSRQRRGDASLALLALPRQLVEDRCGIRVGAGSAHQDAIDGCGPGVDVDADSCEPCQRVLRARRVQKRAHVTSFRDRNRLVVAGDRHVEEGLEDALLRGEQPIDRGLRDLGRDADPLDGRRAVSRSRKRVRAASSTARRANRVRACGARDLSSAIDGIELLVSCGGSSADVEIDGRSDQGLERRLVELRTLDDVDRPPRARIEAGVEQAVGVVE